MRLRLAYLLAWALATTVVAAASWLGVRTVLISPAETRAASAALPQRPATPTPRSSSRAGRPTAPPSPGPAWTPVPNGRGGTAYRRTFRTNGGEVLVWAEPGLARVQDATPRAGYTVDISRLSADAVQVSFVRDRQAYRILVRWWDAPYAELTESTI